MHRHVLMKTNMIDSLTETYQGMPIPKELETKRAEVLKERDILKARVRRLRLISQVMAIFRFFYRLTRLLKFLSSTTSKS